PSSGANIADFESPFEEEVAKEIRLLGYDVDSQVGTSNYRIDLGIRHRQKTGVYFLGIECDGASYHSSYNARDRDRIREEKLREYFHTLHRIWSTSWIQNKRKEIELLTEAIRRAEARGDEISISRIPLSRDKLEGEDPAYSEIKIIPTTFSSIKDQVGVPYRVWDLGSKPNLRRGAENDLLHTRSYSNLIRSMLLSLVENEGPIHRDNAVRRIALAAGYEKSALKITRAVELAIGQCKLNNSILERNGFLWPAKMSVPPVRFPVEKDYLTYRKIQEISEEELELAMKNIIKLGMSLELESIMEETARLFGFGRTGDQIRETLQERINELLKRGEFKLKDGYIHLDDK
ncbi:MAG: DUF3320 domain-containing protein, partial [Thaumarchaeota archaeon]|nr:DUF3320 domain-containing protein [Nitrososphaerota archaeon]